MLHAEPDAQVRLGLARALRGHALGDEIAEHALGVLLQEDGMPGLQAAILLAADQREDALSKLEVILEGENSLFRRIVARAPGQRYRAS